MSSFDARARTWDENPIHMNRSLAIAEKMEECIPLKSLQSALEYGAGTGNLSFLLKDSIAHITTMDNSTEMVKVMLEKLDLMQISNIHPLQCDLEKEEYSEQTFDLVFMQMVLHHVIQIKPFLEKCFHLLNVGGSIAIADLYTEDGSFHGAGFDGHWGFNIEELSKTLLSIGFSKIEHEQCYDMQKTNESGQTKSYPIFLLRASK